MTIPDIHEVLKHYPEFSGIHPACEAVPMIDEVRFEALVENIRANGLDRPIVRLKGQLLDGRTRLLACHVVGQEIRVQDDDGVVDPWKLVEIWNIHRRDLTVGQRGMFYDAWRESVESEAKSHLGHNRHTKSQEILPDSSRGQSRDKLGAMAGVSGKSMDKVRTIKQHAPDAAEKVKAGTMSLEQGYKEAKQAERSKQSQPAEKPFSLSSSNKTVIVTTDGAEKQINQPKTVRFNQTTDAVDWAAWTWNPVTGCEHGCKFCYAREIAHKTEMAPYYPNQFQPTFHEYRLAAPGNTNVPNSEDPRDGRVFVCSMADLFGKWVPNEWIEKVFDACLRSPDWTYLFLTKWPERYSKMPLIERAWYGSSVIQQSDVARVEKAMLNFDTPNATKWMSLEPMLGPIKFKDLSWCDLVVIGSQTSTTQPDGFVPAFAPKFDWVVDVVNQCRSFNVPYYLKANLGLAQPGMELPKSLPRTA